VVLYAEPHGETTRGFLPVDRVRYALDEDLAASVDGGDRSSERQSVLPDERPVRSEHPIGVAAVDGD
jgi:hypothetical protein